MNEAQIAAIRRAMMLVDNIRAGGYKLTVLLQRPDMTVEQLAQFGQPYAAGIDAIGGTAVKYLEAAINDRDYPPLA